MKKWNLLLAFSSIVLSGFLQNALAIDQQTRSWNGADFDGTFVTGKPWHYNLFTQTRFDTNNFRLEGVFIRPSIYRTFHKYYSVWLGYDAIPTWNSGNAHSVLEQRVWNQFAFNRNINRHLNLGSRSRLELRWREGDQQIAYRFRQRILLSVNNFNKANIALSVFDEFFINLNNTDWTARETIDQNRIYAGLSFPINKSCKLDIGYMNLYRPRQAQSRIDNIIVLGLGVGLGEPLPAGLDDID